MHFKAHFLLVFCFLYSSGIESRVLAQDLIEPLPQAQNPSPRIRTLGGFGDLTFEGNVGQADPSVKLLARSGDSTIFFTSSNVVLVLGRGDDREPAGEAFTSVQGGDRPVLGIELVGSSAGSEAEGEEKLAGKTHYLVGNDSGEWHTGVPLYRQVRYNDIYPAIDLVYYGNKGHLEYDFVVKPGGDPDRVELRFSNSDEISVDADGNLTIELAGRQVVSTVPTVFQRTGTTISEVECSYVLRDERTVGFQVGAYDRRRPLVIDPVLVYSTKSYGLHQAVALDAQGNIYATGRTSASYSHYLPTSEEAFQADRPGDDGTSEAYVMKMSPSGNLIYSTYLGGSSDEDRGFGIAVDSNGQAVVTGITWSQNFPVRNAAQAEADASEGSPNLWCQKGGSEWECGEGFVSKLNSDGSDLVFSTFLGGTHWREYGVDVALDPDDNIYVAGRSGGRTVAVTKYSPAGSVIYSKDLGGNNALAIAVDSAGNSYILGIGDFPTTPGAYQAPFDAVPNNRLHVLKLSSDGSTVLFSSYLGNSIGDETSQPGGIAVDSGGKVYVTGRAGAFGGEPAGFPTTASAFKTEGVNGDHYLAVLDASGSQLLYSTLVPGHPYNSTRPESAIALDSEGYVYIVGSSESTEGFPLVEPIQEGHGGRVDAFLLKIDPSKSGLEAVQYSSFLGGSRNDWGSHLTVSPSGTAYLVGTSDSSDFPVTRRASGFGFLCIIDPDPVFPLVYDQVEVENTVVFPSQSSSPQQTLPQFLHSGPGHVVRFSFEGRAEDGKVALRVFNTRLHEADFPPVYFSETCQGRTPEEQVPCVRILDPNGAELLPFGLPNIGIGNSGLQFDVNQDGLYTIEVRAEQRSQGPFPASFDIHFSGDVGLPQKQGEVEPRATRQDILINHIAPRPQTLVGSDAVDEDGTPTGQTALFKFASARELSQFANAVIIPLAAMDGSRFVRGPDPLAPLSITTPTARSMGCFLPEPGMVLDFTQIPDPRQPFTTSVNGRVCAAIGQDGTGAAVSLPLNASTGTFTGLILDMGSGEEIVDGTGNDFRVIAEGDYTVAVGNTPYTETFVAFDGVFSETTEFDLSAIGLASARFVFITAEPAATLDAVKALNLFFDQTIPSAGPYIKETAVTITARKAKETINAINPFLELIGADGSRLAENNDGFGDTNQIDAALVDIQLPREGFNRFLVRGSRFPAAEAFGSFFVRLETPGIFDRTGINISNSDEGDITPQKQGQITEKRQRDSYLFEASPGTSFRISVTPTAGSGIDPVVELYDPEGFLIAANDNAASGPEGCQPTDRGKDAVLCATLPTAGLSGDPLPNPATFRIVVSTLDTSGSTVTLDEGTGYLRQAATGNYALRLFTGVFSGPPADDDADGVNDAIEDGAPNNGDGNEDGIPDREQKNVASLPNQVDGEYVTLDSSDGTSLSNVTSVAVPQVGDAPDGIFPIGLLDFGILDLESDTIVLDRRGAVVVEIYLPRGVSIDSYFNFGPTPENAEPHWYEFLYDGATGAEIQRNRITLHFEDGERGDHDLTRNRQIATLGGPILKSIGQSLSLYFPFYQADAVNFCGFAVSNFSNNEALLQFQTYGPSGTLQGFPNNPATFHLAGQRQFALLGNEIFGAPASQAQNGWIELAIDNNQIGSFFMVGSGTKLDGAVAFENQSQKFYFTRVFEGESGFFGEPSSTYLSIANPNDTDIRVKLTLMGPDQQLPLINSARPTATEVEQTIPAKGVLTRSASELFGADEFAEYIDAYVVAEVVQGTGAVGFELIRLEDVATLIGLNASVEHNSTELFSAQFASSETIFTDLNLINTSSQEREVHFTAIDNSGTEIGTVSETIAPGASLSTDVGLLFDFDFSQLVTGSVRVEGGPGLIGDVIFGDYVSSAYAAALRLQNQKFRKAAFSQVANTGDFFTGLALHNPGSEVAKVTIEVYRGNGSLAGNATLELPGGGRLAQTLAELVPETGVQVGGYIVVSSDQPLVAQQLFGDFALSRLASVPPTIIE